MRAKPSRRRFRESSIEALEGRRLLAQVASGVLDSPTAEVGQAIKLTTNYSTQPAAELEGLTIRIHFDPSKVTIAQQAGSVKLDPTAYTLPENIRASVESTGVPTVGDDSTDDFDSDASTTKYVFLAVTPFPSNLAESLAPLIDLNFSAIAAGPAKFNYSIFQPISGTPVTTSATATITEATVAVPSLSIAATEAVKNEGNSGNTSFTFTVTRAGSDLSGASTVNYAVTGSGANAADAADFGGTLPSGNVTFAANETSKVISVPVSGDTTVESGEGFTVTLSSPTGSTLATSSATGTINNDDTAVVAPTLSIAATEAAKNEGNSGNTSFTFTVTRAGSDLSGASTVNYAVTGSGANAADAADFGGTLPSGNVTFAANETSKVISVPVSGDTTVESGEGFTVTLSSPTGSTLATSSATGTINNDDTAVVAPTLSIAATEAAKNEGNSGNTSFTFTVTRAGSDLSGASTVNYAVTGSGANAADAADFGGTLPSGNVSFAANETSKVISISVRGDATIESNEDFTVTLSSPTGSTLATSSDTGTIRDDDRPTQTRMLAPHEVARPHVIPGDGLATGMMFTVSEATVVTVGTIGFAAQGSTLTIIDGNFNPVGETINGLFRASLDAGGPYALVLPADNFERIYWVRSSAGKGALTRVQTNLFQPTDTNGDGSTSAQDVLAVVNRLKTQGTAEPEEGGAASNNFLDVNSDGAITSLDALRVINHLSRTSQTGEGESNQVRSVTPTFLLAEVVHAVESTILNASDLAVSFSELENLHPDRANNWLDTYQPNSDDLMSETEDFLALLELSTL